MLKFSIEPFRGISGLSLGTERSVCRAIIGGNFKAFARNGGPLKYIDEFVDWNMQLNFDANDRLEFIEAYSPAHIEYRGVLMIDRELSAVVADFERLGIFGQVCESGYIYDDYGFTMYVPFDVVETVAVYRRGYYDTPTTD